MSCDKIDDIFSLLKDMENQGYLSGTPENNQIQTLKYEIRYMRMHLKWATNLYQPLLCNMRTWVENVEVCLLESKRQGIMASKLSNGKFYNLLLIMKLGKAILRKQCTLYYEDELYGLNLSCKDIPIIELLSECIDPLLENLKHLIQCSSLNLLVFPKEQIESIGEKLRDLRKFLEITGTEVLDVLNYVTPNQGFLNKKSELLSRIKRLIENAIYAFCYSWAKGKVTRMEQLFFDMQVKINHIEPEVRVIYVKLLKASKIPNIPNAGSLGIDLQALAALDTQLDNLHNLLQEQDTGSMNPLDVHQIKFLQKELSFIKYFLLDPQLKQYFETEPYSFNSLMMQVEAMARRVASYAHFIHNGRKMDEMNLLSSNLVEIDHLKSKIRKIYEGVPKPSISNFPRVPKLGFLEFLIQKLDELLKHRDDLLTYVKEGFDVVQTELRHLLYLTSDTIKKPTDKKRISRYEEEKEKEKEEIAGLIVEVAYEAEYIIDLISTSNIPNWCCLNWLSGVIEKIKKLREDSLKVFGGKTYNNTLPTMEKASAHDGPCAYKLATEAKVVGLDDEAECVIHLLLRGDDQLVMVSIVGRGGIGKTTLARKVYEHASVTRYFDVRSWYCISQIYDRRNLLLGILGDVSEFSEEIWEMDDNELADALHKSLQHVRYLIVLDDIWSIDPWDDISNLFPDNCNGSRILFTSRFRDLCSQANPKWLVYEIRFLYSHESFEILLNKVFNGRRCPPELYNIGRRIVRTCGALPLTLVLIAGVLSVEESEDHWKLVLDTMIELTDADMLTIALELSYKYLPDHLKPCFLYLGAFPKDKEIPSWKLIHLWIAEGFIRQNKSKSPENVAEDYLMELIARGLLLIGKYKSKGRVKSCRVHDILLEFSSLKGKDENFLVISDQMVNLEQYRHFFYCKHILGHMPSDPYIRSLIFFPMEKKPLSLISNVFYNLNAFDLSVIPYILKLLRVLDLEHIHLDSAKFPADIGLLVHLRYLAVQGRMKHVPSSVANLWRLETFRVVGTRGEVKLPESLLEMAYLKNVYVSNEASFELSDTYEPEKSCESDSIERLSTISLRHGDLSTEKVIKSLRSARKLKCIFYESSDCSTSCSQFPALNLLNKLESLNVTYQGNVRVQHPCDLIFPSNLKKVTLSNFCFPWSEISKLWRLPQLEVIKLLSKAFEGRIWDSTDCRFGKLKFLKLESLNIKKWNASPLAFPCLEQIVLKKCSQLLEIPPSLGELATLRTVQVQWGCSSVVESANKIKEKRLELGIDGLQVLI